VVVHGSVDVTAERMG